MVKLGSKRVRDSNLEFRICFGFRIFALLLTTVKLRLLSILQVLLLSLYFQHILSNIIPDIQPNTQSRPLNIPSALRLRNL